MFAKLVKYFAFICRRERTASLIWIVSIVGLAVGFAALFPNLVPDQAAVDQMGAAMANPAMVAMMGNVYGLENLTQASIMAQECLIWFLVAAAIMNILLVNRHTRADEERGRLEMFRALPVGRLTGSLAVIKFAFLLNLVISLLTGALLLPIGLGGGTGAGAFTYGFAIGAVGLLFAALTLLAAQLFSTAQAVSGFGFGAILVFYLLRASGDVSGNILSYISPLGLGLKVEAFYANRALPLVLLLVESIVLTGAALALNAVRDHGAGLIPAGKGRAHASRFLRSPLGYAWRLTRGAAWAWGAGIFLLGASYASVIAELDAFIANNEMMQKILAQGGGNVLLDNYVALIFLIMSMVTSVPVILIALKIHGEEKRGRLEQVYARRVPRAKLYGSFLLVAAALGIALQFLLAAGLWATAGGELALGTLLKAGFAYLPAIWLMAAIAVFLVGALPRLVSLIWAIFAYSFFILYMGGVLDLPVWTGKITPFGHVPQLPVQEFTLIPLLVLTALALSLTAWGLRRYRERDIG